jgi:hypothetical protein
LPSHALAHAIAALVLRHGGKVEWRPASWGAPAVRSPPVHPQPPPPPGQA